MRNFLRSKFCLKISFYRVKILGIFWLFATRWVYWDSMLSGILFFLISVSISFCLHWIFVAVRRLSLVAVNRGHSPVMACVLVTAGPSLWSTGFRRTGLPPMSIARFLTTGPLRRFLFFFYWNIVDLSFCVSTARWFSYTYIYIYSFPCSFP